MMPPILRKLTKHFLEHSETIMYRRDGTWSHNRNDFTSFPAYVAAWVKRHFGQDKIHATYMMVEDTLMKLGPGSAAEFTPITAQTPAGLAGAVNLRILDPHRTVLYSGNIYYDYEEPEWFGISVRMACSFVNGMSASSALR